MGPILQSSFSLFPRGVEATNNDWRASANDEDFVVESWSEGLMVGTLLIMACITVANMRRGIILHKLILAEQLCAMAHGTFCFMSFKGYGWYLSSTATFLYFSYFIHNVVAWLKVRPFFTETGSIFTPKVSMWVSRIYLGTLALTIPALLLQIVDNFLFFNNIQERYKYIRPYEPLMRDPWWVFTCIALFHVVRKTYGAGTFELIKRSPRFGILMASIILAIIFTVCDIVASIKSFTGTTDGINPWWKLSLIFKCLTDTVMLDDFKTELNRLGMKRMLKDEKGRQHTALIHDQEMGEMETKPDYEQLEFATNSLSIHPSASNDSSGRGRRPSQRDQIGRVGMKISHLPSLEKEE